jgi:hypothetical protein
MRSLVGLMIVLAGCTDSQLGDAVNASSVDDRGDLIACRGDDACPRGSYCEVGLNICFTPQRCYVDGRPSDELCERTFGDDFACFEYAPGSHHCVPTVSRPELVECRSDRECPRGSYCEPGLNACFTGSRCYVDGRPSTELCERTYGDGFVCYEYAPDSHHCVPTL